MNAHGSLLALLVACSGAACASAPDVVAPGPVVRASSASMMTRPAEIVAARVRAVLEDHASAPAWHDLADALPTLALSGAANIESTLEAARIAEELASGSAGETLSGTDAAVASDIVVAGAFELPSRIGVLVPSLDEVVLAVESYVRSFANADVDTIAQTLAVLIALYALAMVLKGRRGSERRPAPARPRASAKGRRAPAKITLSRPIVASSRLKEARALAAAEVPIHEIARRTGLAREAVSVLLTRAPR